MNNTNHHFQYKLLKNALDNDKKDDENITKVLLLKNELQGKNKQRTYEK